LPDRSDFSRLNIFERFICLSDFYSREYTHASKISLSYRWRRSHTAIFLTLILAASRVAT